ncbi:MAG: ABC transporter permease subunit [Candidatus Competibacteraceae bacterium]|nr:ABC transporter permease subunit [Candidatus Competibacteraceae bacterium]
MPLAGGGHTEAQRSYRIDPPKPLSWVNADEYRTAGLRVAADGAVSLFHLETGRLVATAALDFGGERATAVDGVIRRDQLAFGFADGSVRFATVGFDIKVITRASLPASVEALEGGDLLASGVLYSPLPGDQYRRLALNVSTDEPQTVADHPIVAIGYQVGGTVERPTRSFVTFDSQGIGRLSRAETQINLITRKARTNVRTATLPSLPEGTKVTALALTSQADGVYVATASGELLRYDTRDFDNPVLAETRRVFTDQGVEITALSFLVGDQALVVAGSNGAVDVYFRLQPPGATTVDGYEMVRARRHEAHGAAVVDLAVSERSKALVTQAANGEVWVRHSTSDQVLFKYRKEGEWSGSSKLLLTPRMDGVVLIDDTGNTNFWRFYYPHPETTLQTIFGKVWYEGYAEPSFTWQSSSGTDVFEPKFSLVPLIFGTLKATVYSLMFAIPIALLGAIYTSEFVHRRVRATIKPVMEMMESLPTVVLGFVAALILAPIVESWIAAVILAFVALPLGLMLAAYLWQLLPPQTALHLDGIPKFLLMFVVIALACYSAYLGGPLFENVFFNGDLKAWTNGAGSGLPFVALLGYPLAILLTTYGFRRFHGEAWRLYLRELPKQTAGLVDMGRWLAVLTAAALLSLGFATLLHSLGYDPRGGIVDSYVQRNALVVGLVMGFAVIPNIYTLAEDALNAVPTHLRAASLAAGATPWQTAMWVVLPTAMSGVFAAVMIGMGRAVGETMIVVMAAGNTPVLDWNIFNGLRTLSANIAVELPEAVKDGSLYRMLFLAALTLFAMTFVINTFAEIIRQRFRKRAFQL